MRLHAAALLVLVACAESAPSSPPPSTPPPASHVVTSSEQANANAITEYQRASNEAARVQNERTDAWMKSAANVNAEREAKEKADRDAQEKACTDSRPARVAVAKAAIVEHMKAETRVMRAAKDIQAACKITTKKTGALNVQRSGSGWRVSPELAQDVTCSKPLPAGITKDDAYVILWRVSETGKIGPIGPMLERDEHHPDDMKCAAFDKAVGLDWDAITFDAPGSSGVLTKW